MILREHASDEKLTGSYYTPQELADFIVRWGMENNDIENILEPSCGDGVFVQSIANNNIQEAHVTAVEINTAEAMKVEAFVQQNMLENIEVINGDFYDFYRLNQEQVDNNFSLIVGNPPYIRYQYLTEGQRQEQSDILINSGMKSNKLINAWVSFVVACVNMLSTNGKLGLVIPAELLQVAYAEDLRMFLMNRLQHITVITFRQLVFDNIEQEVVVLLGEKDENHEEEHQIRILEFQNVQDLVENFGNNAVQFQDVELNSSKWTKYFLSNEDNQLIDEIKNRNEFRSLGSIAKVDVGITTGNNNYFCVNRECVEEYNLNEFIVNGLGEEVNPLRPLIARSVSIKGINYTQRDMEDNLQKGVKAYLLAYPQNVDRSYYPEGHRRYIDLGERNNENRGYKCSIRQQWYSIPSVWVPDAFLLRRNHLYPKFLLNTDINAVSTDTMHRVRFNEGINEWRAVLAYYNSITFAFTEIEARSYGGGVLEILPREAERVYIANIFDEQIINDDTVMELVHEIDRRIRNDDGIDGINDILNFIDDFLLNQILGIEQNVIDRFRNMWNILRERRLGRGR